MDRSESLIFKTFTVFLFFFCFILTEIRASYAEKKNNFNKKEVYKKNEEKLDNAKPKYQAKDNRRYEVKVERNLRKGDEKYIKKGYFPSNRLFKKDISRGTPPPSKEFQKNVAMEEDSKRKKLWRGTIIPDKRGVKEADIKGSGSKPYTKQIQLKGKGYIKNGKTTQMR